MILSRKIRFKPLLRAVLLSLSLSLAISAYVTLTEWQLNPGAIYRGAHGTEWHIVWETFSSWQLPLLSLFAAIFLLAEMVMQLFKRKNK
jgi:hypothetical protein